MEKCNGKHSSFLSSPFLNLRCQKRRMSLNRSSCCMYETSRHWAIDTAPTAASTQCTAKVWRTSYMNEILQRKGEGKEEEALIFIIRIG